MKRSLTLVLLVVASVCVAGTPGSPFGGPSISGGGNSAFPAGGIYTIVNNSASLGTAVTNLKSTVGAYIYLLPGNYTNYAPMQVPTNGGIVGSGWSTKIFNFNTNGNNHQGGIIPTDGCTIENLLLTNAVALSNQFCIGNSYVVDPTQPTARNVTIRNCAFYAHGDCIYTESPLTTGAAASLTNEYSCYNSLFYSDYDGITTIGANLGADNNPAFRFKFYNCDILCYGTNFINPAATMTPLNMGGVSQGADTEVWLYGGRVECVNGPAGSTLVRSGINDYTGLHVYGTYCLVSNLANGTINFPAACSTGYYNSTNGPVLLTGSGYSGNGSLLTNLPTATSSQATIVSGVWQTNTSGRFQEVKQTFTITEGAVAGSANVFLITGQQGAALGTWLTNAQCGGQTLSTSLIETNSYQISWGISNTLVWCFTNQLVGAGNSITLRPNSSQLITY